MDARKAGQTPEPVATLIRVRSLRSRLIVLWALSIAACVAAGALLVQISAQSAAAQTGRAEAVVARACDLIRGRFDYYATDWRGPAPPLDDAGLRRDLTAAVAIALSRQQGVEGGIWQTDAGPLAYAYPTYAGGNPKLDLPAAETGRIRSVNEQAASDEAAVARQWASATQTLLLYACPLNGPIPGLTAWTMTRVQAAAGAERLRLGLGVLLALVLGMSAWLAWLLLSWSRQVGRVEAALAGHAADTPPAVARTGEPDLDRIVEALNQAGVRLAAAQRQSKELAAQVAASERLAALGRVAAGVAHEVRNPIAAMRLRAENALAAGDEERRTRALQAILEQVARLDRLSGELLAMTQRRAPRPETTDLAGLLAACADDCRERALAAGVALRIEGGGEAKLDPVLVRRILDNLAANAIRHTPPRGEVTISAQRQGDWVRFLVKDTGPGVAPALRATLFEPFVTGHPDGTGLGLAIAREAAEAQGGRLALQSAGGCGQGACFLAELPATQRAAPPEG